MLPVAALVQAALEARRHAYCPYSHYAVGAALLSAEGEIVTGCNVENVTQGPGCCAERTALCKAVSEGVRTFTALAVAGGPEGEMPTEFCPPCGVCRQALAEFCGGDFPIFLIKSAEEVRRCTLNELLPFAFQKAAAAPERED